MTNAELKVFKFDIVINDIYSEGNYYHIYFVCNSLAYFKKIIPAGWIQDMYDVYIFLKLPTIDPSYYKVLTRDFQMIYKPPDKTIVYRKILKDGFFFDIYWNKSWRHQRAIVGYIETHTNAGHSVVIDIFYDGKNFKLVVSNLVLPIEIYKKLSDYEAILKTNIPGKYKFYPSGKIIRLEENQLVKVTCQNKACWLSL